MSDKGNEVEFLKHARNLFNRSVADIDAGTLEDLRKRRQYAIDRGKRRNLAWIYYPAGAVAAACLAVIIYTFTATTDTKAVYPDDLDMLSQTESLDFYENLEFYEWLEDYDVST